MRNRNWGLAATAVIALLGAVLTIAAQDNQQPDPRRAKFQAHKGDFDYLLGDWEFNATNQQYGKFRGYWSAARLGDSAAVVDEYRVVDDKGESQYFTYTVRAYNANLDRWELVGIDTFTGLQNFGTSKKENGEVWIEQKFGVGGPAPSTWRIHYFNIRADGFSWSADRSTDDGKTWTKDFQTIEAKRVGPPKAIPAMTSPKPVATAK